MKLKAIKTNITELQLANGTVVMFSYDTPVAAFIPGRGYLVTNKKWSVTTSKHITQWAELHHIARDEMTGIEQIEFDTMIACL